MEIKMKQVPLNEVKNELSRYLRHAEKEDIIITKHGKPAGILKGFKDEDDWLDYRIEHDPIFLAKIEKARKDLRSGKGVSIASIK
jgi:prevent-host-death family protein